MEGEPGLHVTGQLGEVMSESAHIALSFVRANADELGVAKDAFDKQRFHLHVPAGAVPKDGPSAGITMTALARLLTGRPVKAGVGMTGEVTLQVGAADRRAQAEGARRSPRGSPTSSSRPTTRPTSTTCRRACASRCISTRSATSARCSTSR